MPGPWASIASVAASNPRQARRWLATNSEAWRRLRASILASEPLCRRCAEHHTTTPATVVDHINGRADRPADYRRENLQSLCESCHAVKTALEDGSFGRTPGTAKAKGCDEHGTPLDRSHPWHTPTRR